MSKIQFPSVEPGQPVLTVARITGLAQTALNTHCRDPTTSLSKKKKNPGMDDVFQGRRDVQVYRSIRSIRKPGFWVLLFPAT